MGGGLGLGAWPCLALCLYRQLLIAGRKGHLASMDWKDKKLGCEFHVREAVRDVQ